MKKDKSKYSQYKDYLFCSECLTKRHFEIQGNIKICKWCGTRSSYRHQNRQRWVYGKSHPDSVDSSQSPFNQPCDGATKNKFEEVIMRFHKLSPRERQVIELLWEGKTEQETAIILGIGRGNVSTLLNRARIKLQ